MVSQGGAPFECPLKLALTSTSFTHHAHLAENKLSALPFVPGVDDREPKQAGSDSDEDDKGKKKKKKKKKTKVTHSFAFLLDITPLPPHTSTIGQEGPIHRSAIPCPSKRRGK